VGFPIQQSKVAIGPDITILGAEIKLGFKITMCISQSRIDGLLIGLTSIIEEFHIWTHAMFSKITGKMNFLLTVLGPTSGVNCCPLLTPFFWLASTRIPKSTARVAIIRAAKTLSHLFKAIGPTIGSKVPYCHAPVTFFGDANFVPKEGGFISGIILHPNMIGKPLAKCYYHFVKADQVPKTVNPIAFLEAMAVLTALHLWKDELLNRGLYVHTDNAAVFYGLVRGRNRNPTFCRIIHTILAFLAENNIPMFCQWIPSKWNIADLLTRIKCEAHIKKIFGQFRELGISFSSITSHIDVLPRPHDLWDNDEWDTAFDPSPNFQDPAFSNDSCEEFLPS